jgi:hypothetical protein
VLRLHPTINPNRSKEIQDGFFPLRRRLAPPRASRRNKRARSPSPVPKLSTTDSPKLNGSVDQHLLSTPELSYPSPEVKEQASPEDYLSDFFDDASPEVYLSALNAIKNDNSAIIPPYSSVGAALPLPRRFSQRISRCPDSIILRAQTSPRSLSIWLGSSLHIAIVAQITSVRHQRPGFEYLDWMALAVPFIRRQSPDLCSSPFSFIWPMDVRSLLLLDNEEIPTLLTHVKTRGHPQHVAATIIVPSPSPDTFRTLLPFTSVVIELPDGANIFSSNPNFHRFPVAFAFVIDSFINVPPLFCIQSHVSAAIHPNWGYVMPQPHCAMQDFQEELKAALTLYPDDDDVLDLFTGINFGVNLNFSGVVLAPSLCLPSPNFYKFDITAHLKKEQESGFSSVPLPVVPGLPFQPLLFNLVCSPVYGSQVKVTGKTRPIVNMSHEHRGNLPSIEFQTFLPAHPEVTDTIHKPLPIPVTPNVLCIRFAEDTWPAFNAVVQILIRMGEGSLFIDGDAVSAYMIYKILPQDLHLLGFVYPSSKLTPRDIGAIAVRSKVPLGCTTSYDTYQCLGKIIEFIFRECLLAHFPDSRTVRFVDDCKGCLPPGPDFQPQLTLANRAYQDLVSTFERVGIPMAKWMKPHQRGTWSGHVVDSQHPMSATLKGDRRKYLIEGLRLWCVPKVLYKTHVDVMSWHGTLRHAVGVVPDALIFINPTRLFMKLCGRRDRTTPGCTSIVPDSVKAGQYHLLCLLVCPLFTGVRLLLPAIHRLKVHLGFSNTAASDAAFVGMGAVFGNRWFGEPFPPEILQLSQRATSKSINFLEGVGIVNTCATGGPHWKGSVVTLATDSLGFVQAFNNQQTDCPFIDVLLVALHHIQAVYQFKLILVHIPGVENTDPDLLSRQKFADFRRRNPCANPDPTPLRPWPVPPSWPGSGLKLYNLLHPISTRPPSSTGKTSASRN